MLGKPLPSDWCYWVEGDQLRLSGADQVRGDGQRWSYATVSASRVAYAAFLVKAEAAGVAPEVIASIKQELSL